MDAEIKTFHTEAVVNNKRIQNKKTWPHRVHNCNYYLICTNGTCFMSIYSPLFFHPLNIFRSKC